MARLNSGGVRATEREGNINRAGGHDKAHLHTLARPRTFTHTKAEILDGFSYSFSYFRVFFDLRCDEIPDFIRRF